MNNQTRITDYLEAFHNFSRENILHNAQVNEYTFSRYLVPLDHLELLSGMELSAYTDMTTAFIWRRACKNFIDGLICITVERCVIVPIVCSETTLYTNLLCFPRFSERIQNLPHLILYAYPIDLLSGAARDMLDITITTIMDTTVELLNLPIDTPAIIDEDCHVKLIEYFVSDRFLIDLDIDAQIRADVNDLAEPQLTHNTREVFGVEDLDEWGMIVRR